MPELQSGGRRVLEIPCGDGMTGRLLADYGHDVTLCDIEDWRDERARSVPFLICDVCDAIPFRMESFDLIISYNSFEHFADPHLAFRQIERVCRPEGLVILCFGPLYCSPWGLHAYWALNLPYPQFLFSDSFVREKVNLMGLYDLGRQTNSLQPLNGCRVTSFVELWRVGDFEVLEERIGEDWSHLDLVTQYPQAFQGRGLSLRDLVASHVSVVLRKKSCVGNGGSSWIEPLL